MQTMIEKLAKVLRERRSASPDTSYTASLMAAGLPKLEAKLNEELAELIEAAERLEVARADAKRRDALVHETADLWFHTMVLLSYFEISPVGVLEELEHRFGTSGLEEKRARNKDSRTV